MGNISLKSCGRQLGITWQIHRKWVSIICGRYEDRKIIVETESMDFKKNDEIITIEGREGRLFYGSWDELEKVLKIKENE